MSTRRDRAARAVAVGIWPHAEFTAPEMLEAYRIGDLVLAEVDRIPDVSELDAWVPLTGGGVGSEPSEVDSGTTPPSPYPDAAIYCEHILDGEDCALAADHASPFSRVAPGNDRWHVTLTGRAWPAADDPQTDDRAERTGTVIRQPRVFELYRHRDVTGKSGTGTVAWGTQWPDGTVALRWTTANPSTVHWDNLDAIIAVHGHQGATEVRWLDGGE